jgi:hypothetical protein
MAEIPADFRCLVAPSYKLCHLNEIPGAAFSRLSGIPHLRAIVETADPKPVTLRPKDLDFAVQILLRTKMPKWHASDRSRPDRPPGTEQDAALVKWMQERIALCQDEIATLEKNALLITKRVGILSDTVEGGYEGLDWYAELALTIQLMFNAWQDHRITGKDLERKSWGGLDIVLSFTSAGTSLQLRPTSVSSMLIYHAAKRVAGGAVARTCDNCHTSFIGGGHGRGRSKKRGDARFCSDRCRWTYHNEQNRKSKS